MRTSKSIVPAMLFGAVVAGCTLLPEREQADNIRLQVTGATATISPAPPTGLTLLVVQPRALPPYATPRFAYLQRDRELRYYADHEWVADPARMVHPVLIAALEKSGRYAAVIAPPTPATADRRLDIEIQALHHDFRSGDPSEVVMIARAQVVSLRDRRVLGTRTIEVRERSAGDPVSGAAAADRALARLLEAIVDFVKDLPVD